MIPYNYVDSIYKNSFLRRDNAKYPIHDEDICIFSTKKLFLCCEEADSVLTGHGFGMQAR